MKSTFGTNETNLTNQNENSIEFGTILAENRKSTGEFEQIQESDRNPETPNELPQNEEIEESDHRVCSPGQQSQTWIREDAFEDVFKQNPIVAQNPLAEGYTPPSKAAEHDSDHKSPTGAETFEEQRQ